MIKGIYGINIAVKNLDEAVKNYESIFNVKAEPVKEGGFAFPGLIGAKLDINGTVLTLISYTDENTAIAKFINTKGEGLFLLSIEVDNIEKDVEALKNKGFIVLLKETAVGNYGKVNFVHPKSAHGVQLELLQPKR
ncbi:MAG: VOC family protein [Deltaproteobacteria bacterium]|nr:VOC family protein [Deltaproteobacteria bacterium]